MADDNKISFELDLDSDNFADQAKNALGSIQKIGDPENISGLLEMLPEVGGALAVAGVAAFAFKEAIDLTEEGEEIERVQNQFQTLADQAGINGNELKDGMEKAAGGLVDTNTLLQVANKSIIAMGASAQQLPQIMTLARQATQVFGGDLTSNFQNITQAISTGNTRMLKHYGIVVDTTKAVQAYAAQNGIAVNEISQAGKQQAIMNAVLEKGQEAFKGVNTDTMTTAQLFTELKTTFTELKDAVAVLVEQTIGPALRKGLQYLNEFATTGKNQILAAFGKGDKQLDAQQALLEQGIQQISSKLDSLKKHEGLFAKIMSTDQTNAAIAAQEKFLQQEEAQLEVLKQKKAAMHAQDKTISDEDIAAGQAKLKQDAINTEAHKKNEEKFQQDIQKIKSETAKLDEQRVNSLEQIETAVRAQDIAAEKEHQNKIQAIQNNTALNTQQKTDELKAEHDRYVSEVATQEKSNDLLREKLLTTYVANSTNAWQGITRAMQQYSLTAKNDLTNFGKLGQQTMQSFQKESTTAFTGIGAAIAQNANIAQAAADAMRAMFLNMIGDRAIAFGQTLLGESIFPPNPLGIAAGTGLLVLGGALKSLAGGGGTSVPSASTSGGGSGEVQPPSVGSTGVSTTDQSQLAAQQQATPQRAVTVNIAGNYLNTQESQRSIMEAMRSETDATNFQYNQIGA